MNNAKHTRRALLSSVVALVICLTMLMGTTFAWFTDTATVSVNTITSGALEIALVDKDGKTLSDKLEFIKADGAAEGEEILWEPGCTYELPAVYIKNLGNLAIKYEVVVTGIEGDAELLDVIEWTIDYGYGNATKGHLAVGEALSAPITIKGHMKEEAGNDYQGKSITGIAINVYATQDTVEYDSTTNQYDKNAEYCEFASDSAEFVELLRNAPTNGELLVVKVAEDMQIEEQISVPAGSNVVVDMNGKTLTAGEGALVKGQNYGWIFYPQDDANLVITGNGTYDMNGIDVALVVQGRADITIENGTFINSGKAEKGYTLINGSINQNHTLTIKDGYFDSGFYEEGNCFSNQRTCINSSSGNKVKIYGGTFVGFNPIAGDEGMAFQCPDCDKTAENPGYCQGVFLDGQNWQSEEIPAEYTITKGTHEDGRPTYTVEYSK